MIDKPIHQMTKDEILANISEASQLDLSQSGRWWSRYEDA